MSEQTYQVRLRRVVLEDGLEMPGTCHTEIVAAWEGVEGARDSIEFFDAWLVRMRSAHAKELEMQRLVKAVNVLRPLIRPHLAHWRTANVGITHTGGGIYMIEFPLRGEGFVWIDDEEGVRMGFYRNGDDEGTIVNVGRPNCTFDDSDLWAYDVAHIISATCGCPAGLED